MKYLTPKAVVQILHKPQITLMIPYVRKYLLWRQPLVQLASLICCVEVILIGSTTAKDLNSYLNSQAGITHQIYAILKGFACADDELGKKYHLPLHASTITVADDSFDIGAYQDWAL